MKIKILIFSSLLFSTLSVAKEVWLNKLDSADNILQKELNWKAYGGQADLKFIYEKLSILNIAITPAPQFPKRHWSQNHLVFSIDDTSILDLQAPYGIISQVKSGSLRIATNISLTHKKSTLHLHTLILKPSKITNKGDLVNFIITDSNGRKLFTASSIHIQLDVKNKLLKMSNIDLFASAELAKLLNAPQLKNQVIAQLNTYNHLEIPKNAKTTSTGEEFSCANNPIWPPNGEVDVLLMNVNGISYLYDVGTDKIVIAPSARLKNIGTADVAWYWKYRGSFPPYNNDQHPYLNWSIYREIDNRFEQISLSGLKHAFFTINSNCACQGGQVLGLGCEDVYGIGNNDDSEHLGPRNELSAFTGIWENCGTFFDPIPCTGSQVNQSSQLGQNRMLTYKNDLTDINNTQLYFQAWYVIRDDINIFNSMGYKPISPVPNGGGGWSINEGNSSSFKNGASLDSYVPKNTVSSMQSSQTIDHNDGHFAVAVKVIDLGMGQYRYNFAVDNYDFDPRFLNFHVPLPAGAQLTDTYFNDPDHNTANDWQFTRTGDILNIEGSASNEQDWGMLFSFSYTTNGAPEQGTVTIDVAEPLTNAVVSATALVSSSLSFDVVFKSGFE